MAGALAVVEKKEQPKKTKNGKRALLGPMRNHRCSESVFAVVGYAGSGTSKVANMLAGVLKKRGYEPHPVKARPILESVTSLVEMPKLDAMPSSLKKTVDFQEIGDRLRRHCEEYGVVAAFMVKQIKRLRSEHSDKKNVYLLDSLKHPEEVALLRHVYGPNFYLIGVGCRPDKRSKRLQVKFKIESGDASAIQEVSDFINRDAEDSEHKFGQQVNKTFHLADYFIDNTGNEEVEAEYTLPDQLKRLEDIVFRTELHRPTADERGMYFAQSAAMRSACLSRQVGASILDEYGNLVSVGANEVPKAGGGAYEPGADYDHRCFKSRKECSNTKQQDKIVGDIFRRLQSENLLMASATLESVAEVLKVTRVKSLIEFSRAVHAEMDALLSLVRTGTKLLPGATLYSTTYPCHNCARHIVAVGISKVIYLEPYAKSLAIELHEDSIADNLSRDKTDTKVEFRPYEGVSPRLYEAVFLKRADLKSNAGDYEYKTESQMEGIERPLWTKTYEEFEEEVEKFVVEIERVEDGTIGA